MTKRLLPVVALTLKFKSRTYKVATNATTRTPLTATITHAELLGYEVLEARLVNATPQGYRYVTTSRTGTTNMMPTYVHDDNVTITVTIKRRLLRDLLTQVVESASSDYWATIIPVERDADLRVTKIKVTENEQHNQDKPRRNLYVTADELRIGIERLSYADFSAAGQHLANALTENSDMTTADVVLQMTVFGEIIYG